MVTFSILLTISKSVSLYCIYGIIYEGWGFIYFLVILDFFILHLKNTVFFLQFIYPILTKTSKIIILQISIYNYLSNNSCLSLYIYHYLSINYLSINYLSIIIYLSLSIFYYLSITTYL